VKPAAPAVVIPQASLSHLVLKNQKKWHGCCPIRDDVDNEQRFGTRQSSGSGHGLEPPAGA
jgi:hypothetical protein